MEYSQLAIQEREANEQIVYKVYVVMFTNHLDDFNVSSLGVFDQEVLAVEFMEAHIQTFKDQGLEVPQSWQYNVPSFIVNAYPFYMQSK